MLRLKKFPIFIGTILFCTAPVWAQDDLSLLVSYLSGSFSNQAQAATDTNFFDIRLHMTPIWQQRSDAVWLYVEQAAAGSPDKPDLQRIYRLSTQTDGNIECEIFEIPDPLRFAGAWQAPGLLERLTPDSLQARSGCAVILRKGAHDMFEGASIGQECVSTLPDARYVTTQIIVGANRLVSWDQGFNAQGEQVWGARSGGYVFVKEK